MAQLVTIFGGQYGSEGKGEVAALITKTYEVSASVRIGGPNAGHTSYDSMGNKVVVQTLPTPSALTGCQAFIGPEGCFIPEILEREIRSLKERMDRRCVDDFHLNLIIDKCAAVIQDEHMLAENGLKDSIGSTGEGVGAVTAAKIMRKPGVTIGTMEKKDRNEIIERLIKAGSWTVVNDSAINVNNLLLDNGSKHVSDVVLIEGTQGYGLSLHTSGFYPFTTSRECTPFALWAGTGVNPCNASSSHTVMVVRTFPIRVGGNSGPIKNEVTWEYLKCSTDGYVSIPEQTTVTKKTRRIAMLDVPMLQRAILQCPVDSVALTFLDYMFPEVAGKSWKDIVAGKHENVVEYVHWLETKLERPISIVSTGPGKASWVQEDGLS
jgi:adenylosuccinate synthase